MDCTLLCLLGLIAVFFGTTASVDNVCTGVMCSTTPPGECNTTCREGDLKTILPDGPLRNLPGTVRNLSLLMDNRNRHSTPTAVIVWRAPIDVNLSVYEVYLYIWNHTALPKASTPPRYMYVVSTANKSHLDMVELRVTSSAFSDDSTITVFINTWVGARDNHKDNCYLRQAKAKFHTMGSLQFPTKRWNYQASVSFRDKSGLSVGFDPLPNATLHDIRLCLRDIHSSRNMDCQTQIVPRGQNTTTFTHSATCATYRIKIIPSPNPYREEYQVDRFVPALQCPVCEHNNAGATTSALRRRRNSEVDANLSVQSIVWSAIAALAGLAIGIVFILMKYRTNQRRLYHKEVCDEDTSSDANAELFCFRRSQRKGRIGNGSPGPVSKSISALYRHKSIVGEELRKAEKKTVCLLYTEDSQCHVKVVEAFVRCLQMYFKCEVNPLNLDQDIQHQLRTQHSDITILVDSAGLDNSLNTIIAIRRSPVSCRLEPSLDPSSMPHSDLLTIHELLKRVFSDNILSVRFGYTNMQTTEREDIGAVYDIPANLYDLVCCVHDLNFNERNPALNICMCQDDIATVDLRSAIGDASACHLTSRRTGCCSNHACACSVIHVADDNQSCVTLTSESFLPPDRVSEFDNLTSISEELLTITRGYERRRYNGEGEDDDQTTSFL